MKTVLLWLKAVRPYAYSASLVPVAVGGLLANALGEPFSGLRFAVALVSGLLLHTAANLWNDYYDFTGGVDRPGAGTGSGVLVARQMTPERCFRGAVANAILGGAGGLWLAWQAGWGLLWLGLAGLLGAWAYSAGPLSPKHRALGEVWVFLLMGVGMTLGGYMAQNGRMSWAAVAAGIPAALLMTLILYTNNLRDLESDRAAGLRTLPMILKPREAKILAGVLLAVPYPLTGLMAATGQLPAATQWVFLTIPPAGYWFLQVWKGPVEEKHVVGIAMLHLVFGAIFACGLWLGA